MLKPEDKLRLIREVIERTEENGGYIADAILATGNTRDERTFLWVFYNLVYEPELGGEPDG